MGAYRPLGIRQLAGLDVNSGYASQHDWALRVRRGVRRCLSGLLRHHGPLGRRPLEREIRWRRRASLPSRSFPSPSPITWPISSPTSSYRGRSSSPTPQTRSVSAGTSSARPTTQSTSASSNARFVWILAVVAISRRPRHRRIPRPFDGPTALWRARRCSPQSARHACPHGRLHDDQPVDSGTADHRIRLTTPTILLRLRLSGAPQ